MPIGHDDAVRVARPDGDFVNADRGRRGCSREVGLLLPVEFVDLRNGSPMPVHLVGDILDRGRAAAATDGQDEASGVPRVRGKPREPFAFPAAPQAINTTVLELQIDRMPATIQVA